MVEGDGACDDVGRRVDRCAQIAMRGVLDRVAGFDGDVVVATWAESDDDDAWPLEFLPLDVGHAQPSATTWPVAESNVP